MPKIYGYKNSSEDVIIRQMQLRLYDEFAVKFDWRYCDVQEN